MGVEALALGRQNFAETLDTVPGIIPSFWTSIYCRAQRVNMDEIIKGIFAAPLATIFVVAGMIFLFVAAVGNISGKVEPGSRGRVISGILGTTFVIIGVLMHLQQTPTIPMSAEKIPAAEKPSQQNTSSGSPQATIVSPQTTPAESDKPQTLPSSTREDKKSNNEITAAYKIVLGDTIRARLDKVQDRAFFSFKTSTHPTGTIRVILRKRFYADVTVYDAVERKVAESWQIGDDPVSFSFDSSPNTAYFLMVKRNDQAGGEYELVVREE